MSEDEIVIAVFVVFVFFVLAFSPPARALWRGIRDFVKDKWTSWRYRPERVFSKARESLREAIPDSEQTALVSALDECESYYAHLRACTDNLKMFRVFIKTDYSFYSSYTPRSIKEEISELEDRLAESRRWLYRQFLSLIAVPTTPGSVKHLLEQVRERRRIEEEIFLNLDEDSLSEAIDKATEEAKAK